ncbi:protein DpdD [Akkermansiaceae bacterium]|nr:protein DpdD [Akkermansiaceae bacterium]MDB4356546.1 protein DpdD [Akkermansiaceae bacterium]MDB4373767.1 protein DpdD [Akkermansiaceae bacterium]
MPLDDWKDEDLNYLKQFYSAGQDWTWDGIVSKDSGKLRPVADWIANLPLPGKHPIVLPLRKDEQSSWMAIAFSEGQCEELRELLNAFIGPICTDFTGSRTKVDPQNPLHQVTSAWAGGMRFFEFQPVPENKEQRTRVRESLVTMLDVLKRRPVLNSGIIRTTEGLLREFRSALVNQDQGAAEDWLKKIRQTGRLSGENLRFLRIEFYAAFGMWREMRLGSEWPLLLRGRRPRRTTALMIEALWWHYFKGILSTSSVEAAIELMKVKVLPENRALFRSHRLPLNVVSTVTFLLAAASDSPPRTGQIKTLLEFIPDDCDERLIADSIAAKLSANTQTPSETTQSDPFANIESSMRRGDYDGAWQLLLDASTGVSQCRLMLECAFEFLTPDTAQVVSAALGKLNDSDRESVLSSRRNKSNWSEIQAILKVDSTPESWEEWLEEVMTSDPIKASEEVHSARQHWNLGDYRNRPDHIKALASRIEEVSSSEGQWALRASLPELVGFFLPDSTPEAEFLSLYLSLLNVVLLSGNFSNQDWGTTETLCSAVLDSGPSRVEYSDMVDLLDSLWTERAELNRLDWALDQLDSLITGPILDEKSIGRFFDCILNSCSRFARRLSTDQRRYFELLCEDLDRREAFEGISWPIEDDPARSNVSSMEQLIAEKLNDRSVGIYSLNESAAVRAGRLIEGIAEKVKVRLNHEYGGSDKLKVTARDSDFMIVVTQSAKHAATNFIKAERPKDSSDLIYPSGRGAASIVNALKEAVIGGLD